MRVALFRPSWPKRRVNRQLSLWGSENMSRNFLLHVLFQTPSKCHLEAMLESQEMLIQRTPPPSTNETKGLTGNCSHSDISLVVWFLSCLLQITPSANRSIISLGGCKGWLMTFCSFFFTSKFILFNGQTNAAALPGGHDDSLEVVLLCVCGVSHSMYFVCFPLASPSAAERKGDHLEKALSGCKDKILSCLGAVYSLECLKGKVDGGNLDLQLQWGRRTPRHSTLGYLAASCQAWL